MINNLLKILGKYKYQKKEDKKPLDEIGRILSPAGKETNNENGISQIQIAKNDAI